MRSIQRRLGVALTVLLVMTLIPVAVLAAGGTFTDDDNSVFEVDIEWLAEAGITIGCNPPANDNFCPTRTVNRGQMAAFLRRFAQHLGAEDGIVNDSNHLGGLSRFEYQPALFDFEHVESVVVTGNGITPVLVGEVVTSVPGACLDGSTPQSDILVRGSGRVVGVDAGETATLQLSDNGTSNVDTRRVVTESNGSFAMEWLFVGDGGTETYELEAAEDSGDSYTIADPQITVEVVQDTRCEAPITVTADTVDSGDAPAHLED